MTRRTPLIVLSSLVVALTAITAQAQTWGNLKGQFVYKGKVPEAQKINVDRDQETCGKHNLVNESLVVGENGGLANVVVYVRTKGVAVHPDYDATKTANVTLDNKNCRFEPHVLPMQISQTLVFKNSDPVGHNSNIQPIGDQGANPLIPAGGEGPFNFHRAQNVPVPVSCNIHPWMSAWVIPRDNPYVAVTGEDGTFEIKNLPTGELEFQVWHEKAGYLKPVGNLGRMAKQIKEGDNDLGKIEVGPEHLTK